MVLFIFIYLVWISICSHCMKDNLQSLWGLHTWKRTTNSHFFAKFVFLYIYTCMVSHLTLIYHLTADNNSSYDWLMILRFCQYNHQQFDSCVKIYWAIFIPSWKKVRETLASYLYIRIKNFLQFYTTPDVYKSKFAKN